MAASRSSVRPLISGSAAIRCGIDHCAACGERIHPEDTLRTRVVEPDAPTADPPAPEQVRAVHTACHGGAR